MGRWVGPGGERGQQSERDQHSHQARPRYWPVLVSTFIFSPVEMNSGTWIVAPVSSVAGLVPPVERSPCTPESVWLMVSSAAAGRSTYSFSTALTATVTV